MQQQRSDKAECCATRKARLAMIPLVAVSVSPEWKFNFKEGAGERCSIQERAAQIDQARPLALGPACLVTDVAHS